MPDLVFLDLRLPKVDGLEILRYIKTTEYLSWISVVAFVEGFVKETDVTRVIFYEQNVPRPDSA